jgi:hypothetical protein
MRGSVRGRAAGPPVSAPVLDAPGRLLVLVAVELVQRGRPDDPQVGSCHEESVGAGEGPLRLDLDVARPVQQEQGLPQRLCTSVDQRKGRSQPPTPGPARPGGCLQVTQGDEAEAECGVDHGHQVDQPHPACRSGERLGEDGDTQAAHESYAPGWMWRLAWTPNPHRSRIVLRERHEDRARPGDRRERDTVHIQSREPREAPDIGHQELPPGEVGLVPNAACLAGGTAARSLCTP